MTRTARDLTGNALAEPVTWSFSTAPEPVTGAPANWKPVIPLVFAIVLELVAIPVARRMARRPGAPWERPLNASGLFSAIELVTGVASMLLPGLAVPPVAGAGLVLDVLILGIGVAIVLFTGLAKGRNTPPPQ